MNCNGYCSQCEQNKSCHFSTRIKNNKTPFREWFERQSYKEQIMDDLQAVINEIHKRLDTDFGGSEDYELGRRAELCYLLGFCVTLSKQETQYVYSTSTGKEFKGE